MNSKFEAFKVDIQFQTREHLKIFEENLKDSISKKENNLSYSAETNQKGNNKTNNDQKLYLDKVQKKFDDRVREQDHNLSLFMSTMKREFISSLESKVDVESFEKLKKSMINREEFDRL